MLLKKAQSSMCLLGTYEDPATIDVAHVTIEGLTDAQINGDIIVNANDITIKI